MQVVLDGLWSHKVGAKVIGLCKQPDLGRSWADGCLTSSQVFEVVSKLIRLVHFPDEHQPPDDLAERVPSLMAVADPGVRDAGVVKGDEIGVVREDNATFREPESDVFF